MTFYPHKRYRALRAEMTQDQKWDIEYPLFEFHDIFSFMGEAPAVYLCRAPKSVKNGAAFGWSSYLRLISWISAHPEMQKGKTDTVPLRYVEGDYLSQRKRCMPWHIREEIESTGSYDYWHGKPAAPQPGRPIEPGEISYQESIEEEILKAFKHMKRPLSRDDITMIVRDKMPIVFDRAMLALENQRQLIVSHGDGRWSLVENLTQSDGV